MKIAILILLVCVVMRLKTITLQKMKCLKLEGLSVPKTLDDFPKHEYKGGVIYQGDCLEIMPLLKSQSIDLVLTDPPYGINKTEWDKVYPAGFEKECLRIANTVAIMCGMWAIPDCIRELGEAYLGIIACWSRNGMTFSPLGFGNWIPVIIAGKRPKSGQDVLSFKIDGYKPNHPSPKPLSCMKKLVDRISLTGQSVLDPFMGSGTTGVACKELGRNFIGIEIEPKYFEIAQRRINNTVELML